MTDSALTRPPQPGATPPARHLPGDSAMWVMVLGDLVIFGAYFLIFMVHRTMAPEGFLNAQRHLDVALGTVNTVALLTSSLFVALSVDRARSGDGARAIRLIYAAAACGTVFIILKVLEWTAKLRQGLTVSNDFYSFYYVLTGVHLLHVLLGLVILGVCVREFREPARRRIAMLEQGAIYWHMVDLLWVAIFGLLYVMR